MNSFFLILCFSFSSVSATSSRRSSNQLKDLPWCIPGVSTEGCRVCEGTIFKYDRTYQFGNPIPFLDCCHNGVIKNGVCHRHARLDKDGELCWIPLALNSQGICIVGNPVVYYGFFLINAGIFVLFFAFLVKFYLE
jgi:hypothetical protein